VWIRYPEREEILDPTPRIPPKLTARISAHLTATVAYLRKNAGRATERKQINRLSATAADIFGLLSEGRLEEFRTDVEPLRQAMLGDAEVALAVIYFACKQARLGRMPFLWHEPIVRRLTDQAEGIETKWWARRADDSPVSPALPPVVMTRAPRTETATRIEAYLHHVEEKTGVKVDKTDFWLRPVKPDGTSFHSSDREFRDFQREFQGLDSHIKKRFTRVLIMPPTEFIEGRDERRLQLRAKRKKRLQR
jgi:hypothetical protein